MKLSPTEYKILNRLTLVVGETLPRDWLMPSTRRVASKMRKRGLISKRAWDNGFVTATALGKRSHSYGPR
jgi:hypothetical protein